MRPFAEWLAARMSERRVKVRQVEIGMRAHGHQVSRSMLSEYRSDKVVPPLEKARAFADFFGASPEAVEDLIRRSKAPDVDDPNGAADLLPPDAWERIQSVIREQVVSHLGRPRRQRPLRLRFLPVRPSASAASGDRTDYTAGDGADELLVVTVAGDCMDPVLKSGQMVAFDPRREARDGDVVAVDHDGEFLVKRLVVRGGEKFLAAEDGTVIRANGETTVLGVCVGVVEIRAAG